MTTISLSLITSQAGMAALQPEWTALFHASATPNPFAHPLWITTWARHYIAPSELYIVAARDDEGALVGVAPFYRWRHAIAPGLSITSVQLLGTGRHAALSELAQAVVQRGKERPILRAIMHYLAEHAEEWDWIEVVLPPEHGWFEPQWLPDTGGFVLHKATRACVLLPLPSSWDVLRTGLKRNIKESLRHGANSLKREGRAWQRTVPTSAAELTRAVDELLALHRARAQVQGKVRHPDQFGDPTDRAFLHDVASRMFAAGHLTPCTLRVDGAPAAARLLLHANGATFFSSSGFDATWWQYDVATTLVAECLRLAIERGDTLANLSPGPDVAKLRWSERLDLHQEFVVVGPRRRSRLGFSLYWQARAAAQIRRERGRHEKA